MPPKSIIVLDTNTLLSAAIRPNSISFLHYPSVYLYAETLKMISI